MPEQVTIDPVAFAGKGGSLEGAFPVAALDRLTDLLVSREGEVRYRIDGGHDPRGWPMIRIRVAGSVVLACQRCLGPMRLALDIGRGLVLVDSEGALADVAEEPADLDEIVAPGELDILSLVEDEILLALPIAPRHEPDECGEGISGGSGTGEESPFAALAALKARGAPRA